MIDAQRGSIDQHTSKGIVSLVVFLVLAVFVCVALAGIPFVTLINSQSVYNSRSVYKCMTTPNERIFF
jgi:hypothetical protein